MTAPDCATCPVVRSLATARGLTVAQVRVGMFPPEERAGVEKGGRTGLARPAGAGVGDWASVQFHGAQSVVTQAGLEPYREQIDGFLSKLIPRTAAMTDLKWVQIDDKDGQDDDDDGRGWE